MVAKVLLPLSLLNLTEKYDVRIDVIGGGLTGQAEASTLGLSRAVLEISEDFRPTLREHGLLTQDRREKERKNMENAVLEKSTIQKTIKITHFVFELTTSIFKRIGFISVRYFEIASELSDSDATFFVVINCMVKHSQVQ